jgi:acetyl-CoA synthetase (ADP-forming)
MNDGVEETFSRARKEGRRALLEPEAEKVCANYGIPVADSWVTRTSEEASRKARELGFPVVLKIISPDIIHKTDAGGVLAGIKDQDELKRGFEAIIANARNRVPSSAILGVLIQRMVPPGIEVIVGGFRDPQFGPTLMFGTGGIFAEVFKDAVFSLAPLEESDAYYMIHSIKAYPLLRGYRNMPRVDEKAIVDILLKASRLISDHPEIDQMDLNPVIADHQKATVVDARIIMRS